MSRMVKLTVYIPENIKENIKKRADKRKNITMSSFTRTAIKEHIRHSDLYMRRYRKKYYNDEDWRNRRFKSIEKYKRKINKNV